MNDLNNNGNPFDEERFPQQSDPYNQPPYGGDPYNMPPSPPPPPPPPALNADPYAQGANPYNQPPPPADYQHADYRRDMTPNAAPNPYAAPPNPYAAPYPQPVYAGAPPSAGMATASMVLGIISVVLWLFMFAFYPLFLLPVIGIVLGVVHKSKKLPVGKGASTAGIVTSSIALGLCILLIVLIVVLMMNGSTIMQSLVDVVEESDPDTYQQLYEDYYEQFPEWFAKITYAAKMFFIK